MSTKSSQFDDVLRKMLSTAPDPKQAPKKKMRTQPDKPAFQLRHNARMRLCQTCRNEVACDPKVKIYAGWKCAECMA